MFWRAVWDDFRNWVALRLTPFAQGILPDVGSPIGETEASRMAERVGFEPTCPCGQDAFEAPPLRPLRYLSVRPDSVEADPLLYVSAAHYG